MNRPWVVQSASAANVAVPSAGANVTVGALCTIGPVIDCVGSNQEWACMCFDVGLDQTVCVCLAVRPSTHQSWTGLDQQHGSMRTHLDRIVLLLSVCVYLPACGPKTLSDIVAQRHSVRGPNEHHGRL